MSCHILLLFQIWVLGFPQMEQQICKVISIMSLKYKASIPISQDNSAFKSDQANSNGLTNLYVQYTTDHSQFENCSFKAHSVFNPILTSTFFKKKTSQTNRKIYQRKRAQANQARRLKQLRNQENISSLKNKSRVIKAQIQQSKQSIQHWQNFYKWSHLQNLSPLFETINFSRTKFRKETQALIKKGKSKNQEFLTLNGQRFTQYKIAS